MNTLSKPQANQLLRQLVDNGLPLTETDHNQLLGYDRALYAALLNLAILSENDAMQIILRLLAVTEMNGQPVSDEAKHSENYLIAKNLRHLPYLTVLNHLVLLVDRKVNNQRTTGILMSYLMGSPHLERMAVSHRKNLKRLVIHALGKHTAQNCVHFLLREDELQPHQVTYLRRNLYRYATDKQLAKQVMLHLWGHLKETDFGLLGEYLNADKGIGKKSNLSLSELKGLASTYGYKMGLKDLKRRAFKMKRKREIKEDDKAPKNLTDLTREYYANPSKATLNALTPLFDTANREVPYWDAKLEIILDDSLSMQGTGTREFNGIAIAANFAKMAGLNAREVNIRLTSGAEWKGDYPKPQGGTSLAKLLANAVMAKPDAVILLSDGYENTEAGDAAHTLTALRKLGFDTPVSHILPVFTERENVAERLPLGDAPYILDTGNRGFAPTWLQLRLQAAGDDLESVLREFYHVMNTQKDAAVNV